ncbi:NAD(+) synthase [Arcanobacterium haemolyticum]|nr:NAD(+) synthase [Arcanobacterium haemolyticum]
MESFYSIYSHGFARVAACTLPVHPVRPRDNVVEIVEAVRECEAQGVALAVFPELSLSGYAIEDLLLQDALIDEVLAAIDDLRKRSEKLAPCIVVGAPLRYGNRLYNCAVVIYRGQVLGVVPKSYLANYREFYEKRHFASGSDTTGGVMTLRGVGTAIEGDDVSPGMRVPFGPDLLFEASDVPGFVFHVEVCEDMWVPIPPSSKAALAGATVLVNLSGSPITVGRAADRTSLVKAASLRCNAAYVYTASGSGESSTDLSWDGQAMIYEMGAELASSARFTEGISTTIADINVRMISQERLRQGSFDDNRHALGISAGEATEKARAAEVFRTISFEVDPPKGNIGLLRDVARFPFVPSRAEDLYQDCYEAYNIQVHALVQRLRAIGHPKLVIGVSGGLDSTHALIVAARAMDKLGRPRTDILAYTMPGFATTDHTKDNATKLSQRLGVSFEEIDIRPAARQMLADMKHPFSRGEEVYDVTFENVQAGLRTDFLFRLANAQGGIVLGTGDLSELALGWCTFGVGDHMSHYNVNPGIPKTLMQHLIRWVASTGQFDDDVSEVLRSILATEISPELVPSKDGNIQSTQQKIGPYELQDFTLFHLLRHGMKPSDIAFLAWHAWKDRERGQWPPEFPLDERHEYSMADIKKWMELFLRRFFANQFKRSTLPNGPKVVAGGTLSPRGDWRMPSDVSSAVWLEELAHVPTSPLAGLPSLPRTRGNLSSVPTPQE